MFFCEKGMLVKKVLSLVLLGLFSLSSPALAKQVRKLPRPLHFFTFGDWGSGSQDQKNVAAQTQKICMALGCDFGLFLGDNFYEQGVKNVEDPLWNTRYVSLYHALQVPLYAALGNHDWRGNPQAEVEYTLRDPYWKMPAYNYSFTYPLQNKTPLLEIFVINSMKFDSEAELEFSRALEKSRAIWKILAFHHPILNNGQEHPMDEKKLWPKLRPLVCGKIDLMLAGHEHIFSHLKNNADTCMPEQLVIGTGGKKLYGIEASTPKNIHVFYAESNYGLGFFEVFPKELRFKFVRENGEVPYQYGWKK